MAAKPRPRRIRPCGKGKHNFKKETGNTKVKS